MPDFNTKECEVGKLRWLVTLAYRTETPDLTTGLTESYTAVDEVHCNIVPINSMTFIGAEQIDSPFTHKIYLRWKDYPQGYDVIIRQTLRPDDTARYEIFRIRRVMEIGGRKRFICCEAELERSTPDARILVTPSPVVTVPEVIITSVYHTNYSQSNSITESTGVVVVNE